MANWELIEVAETICSLCHEINACNVYRQKWGCQCNKCKDMDLVFRFKHICGSCMGKWLKSRELDDGQ